MDIQDSSKPNNTAKIWLLTLLKALIRNGKYNLYYRLMNKVIHDLLLKFKNLNEFFSVIEDNLCVPIRMIKKKIAGRYLLIPFYIKGKKYIKYSIQIIMKSLKLRTEQQLYLKIYNELLDIYNNKGISVKNKINLCNEFKTNAANLRLLKFK